MFLQCLQIGVWILPKPPTQDPRLAALFESDARRPPPLEVSHG
jgi:hypothetical protein